METIDATYRVVTPMFLGGANNESAEFRLPSFKGALRFWWRALAWRRVAGELREKRGFLPSSDEVLDEIRSQENDLFGSTETGQSKFLMKSDVGICKTIRSGRVLKTNASTGSTLGKGVRYLAGQGLMETYSSRQKKAGRLKRGCIAHGFKFTIHLLPRPNIEGKQRDQLRRALAAVGLFGGLGSKSRNGWGSIQLLNLSDQYSSDSLEDFKSTFWKVTESIAGNSVDRTSPYTAFSKNASALLIIGDSGLNSIEFLDKIGREMIWYRSNGRKSKGKREVLGQKIKDPKKDRMFWSDHNVMSDVAQKNQSASTHPNRIVFGLPHNYFFSSTKDTAEIRGAEYQRRASPLLIHAHKFEDGTPAVSVLFLPAQFLPEGEKIDVDGTQVPLKRKNIWDPIIGFIERLKNPQENKSAKTFQKVRDFPI